MNKLYDRIDFKNNSVPALNASNMNAISKAIDDIDNRLCDIIPADDYVELTHKAEEAARVAEEAAESAQAIVGIGIATTETAGIVKPDGTTIEVDEDGTIHSKGGSYEALPDKPFINGVEISGNKTVSDFGIYKIFGSTLVTGATTIEITDDYITDASMIDVYASVPNLNYENIEVTDGTLTITYAEQQNDVDIRVMVI